MTGEPAFYDDLDAALAEALRLLAAGATDRRSAFHTPVLGTIGLGYTQPRLRTVVLRGFDPAKPSIRFHTDRRSMKHAEISANPQVSLHFYDAASKIQLRIEGWATLHAADATADAAWAGSQPASRRIYAVEPPPGAAIAAGGAFALPDAPSPDADDIGRGNFSAVVVDIGSLEWLYLASRGHRRAYFDWSIDGWSKTWLSP